MRPSANQLALAGVALLALSLAGLPMFLRGDEASGSVRGVVLDGRGFGVADAAVFLFDEGRLQLREETRTTSAGDFAFHLGTARARVFVRPPESSRLLPAWGPPEEDAPERLALVLRAARRLTVEVRDLDGSPVDGAEVRVYERRAEAVALVLAETDRRGRAALVAPALADVAVFAPDEPHLARWRFDCAVPEEGAELSFTLPPAVRVRGRILGDSGALAGIAVVAWEADREDGWNGFALSDPEGDFALPITSAPTVVRAFDPSGKYLSARASCESPPDAPLALHMIRGSSLSVQVVRDGAVLPSRVWSWTPDSAAWSVGVLTDPTGRADVPVGARFGVHAEPLDPAYVPLEVWDVPFEEERLKLEASARP